MKILGLDLSSTICGWAISENNKIINAGFFKIDKANSYKEKANIIIHGLSGYEFDRINVEETLLGFRFGGTTQQTIIKLIQNKSVICYILEETWNIPINFINVNSARKGVLGAARIKGLKPKEYVKLRLPSVVSNLKDFEKLNRKNEWDAHNSDMYDAVVCSLFNK